MKNLNILLFYFPFLGNTQETAKRSKTRRKDLPKTKGGEGEEKEEKEEAVVEGEEESIKDQLSQSSYHIQWQWESRNHTGKTKS